MLAVQLHSPFKIVFDYFGFLEFPWNFRISLSISAKKPAGILLELVFNLWINWGSIDILTILSVPILISFQQCFVVICTNLKLFWLNLFQSIVTFDLMVHRMDCIISSSDCSLFRNNFWFTNFSLVIVWKHN